jgi:hypothetical protein
LKVDPVGESHEVHGAARWPDQDRHDLPYQIAEPQLMDLRKVLIGWLGYVAVTTAVYAQLFNGTFGQAGQLPAWVIVTASVMAVCCLAILLYWVREVTTGRVTQDRIGDVTGFFWMIVLTGFVGDMLAVAAEIAFGASAVWLMIPISTITYTMSVVWLYHRYFKKVRGERTTV